MSLTHTQGARTALVDLVRAGSPAAWGAPAVSVIVAGGFFVFLMMLMWGGIRTDGDATVANIVNIAVGALATAFATVVNFWLGSSQGSRVKDAQVSHLQAATLDFARTPPGAWVPTEAARRAVQDGDLQFEQCLALVLDKEVTYHLAHRGEPANLGITLRSLADWKGLDHDALSPEGRELLLADLRALSRREAGEILRATCWLPMRCADLPPGIALMVFDMGITAGPRVAVKLLQRAVGVTDDGSVGPLTLAAVTSRDPARLLDALAEARIAYHRSQPEAENLGDALATRTRQVAALAEAMRA
jgi:lysozyme family protein